MSHSIDRIAVSFILAGALAVGACDGLLDVDNPTVVTPESTGTPEGVDLIVNGVLGNFQRGFDDYVNGSGLMTHELVNAGGQAATGFRAADERTVGPDPRRLPGVWDDVQLAREVADDAVAQLRESQGDPAFSEVEGRITEGIAIGHLYGGYSRVLIGELYCRGVIEENGPARSTEEIAAAAADRFSEAREVAESAGLTELARAARVGLGRARLLAGSPQEARSAVASVPTDFVFPVEYSSNTTEQENDVFQLTHGVNDFLNLTVGDGADSDVHNERWPHYDEWVSQGLIDPDPGLDAFDNAVAVHLQRRYAQGSAPSVLASGWEARMIEAEAALRAGQTQEANDIVEPLVTDPAQAANPLLVSNPSLSLGAFSWQDFTGNLNDDLRKLARARAAGLWLSGTRQGLARRLAEGNGPDLYPDQTQGDAVCIPIPQSEVDGNPNL